MRDDAEALCAAREGAVARAPQKVLLPVCLSLPRPALQSVSDASGHAAPSFLTTSRMVWPAADTWPAVTPHPPQGGAGLLSMFAFGNGSREVPGDPKSFGKAPGTQPVRQRTPVALASCVSQM